MKKLTISTGRIGRFIDSIARPHVVDAELDAAYEAMAEDHEREPLNRRR